MKNTYGYTYGHGNQDKARGDHYQQQESQVGETGTRSISAALETTITCTRAACIESHREVGIIEKGGGEARELQHELSVGEGEIDGNVETIHLCIVEQANRCQQLRR